MLRYVYPIWGTPGDIAIQKRKIDCIKIKSSRLSLILVETVPLDIHRFISKLELVFVKHYAPTAWL